MWPPRGQQGPNIVQAFHERMTRQGGRLFTILSDVVAFANTHGGTVYLGAGINPGPPLGVDDVDRDHRRAARRDREQGRAAAGGGDRRAGDPGSPDRAHSGAGGTRASPTAWTTAASICAWRATRVLAVRDEIVRLVRRALVERGELVEPAKRLQPALRQSRPARAAVARAAATASTASEPKPRLPVETRHADRDAGEAGPAEEAIPGDD